MSLRASTIPALLVLAAASCASLAGLEDFGPAEDDDGNGGSGATGTGGTSVTVGATAMGGAAPHCQDGMLSGDESDEDCGGSCVKCPEGKACNSGTDCTTATCVLMTCASISCADDEMNGTESDVDCGGSCPGCPIGSSCNGADDCQTAQCTLNVCNCNTHVVISEFRSRGPEGAQSEIVELYNASSMPVTLSADFVLLSRDAANASFSTRWSGDDTVLEPKKHYLIGQTYAGAVAADASLSSGITDASAIRLRQGLNTVDSLCVCNDDTSCMLLAMEPQDCPGTPAMNPINQSPIDTNDLSLERKVGGVSGNCQDTDDTDADFGTIQPSDPQNTSSPITPPPAN